MPVFLGRSDVTAVLLVGNFAFHVFIKNQLVADDDEIKIAAYLFPDFEKQHVGNISFGAQK